MATGPIYADRQGEHGRLRYMAISRGYVMVRYKHAAPHILAEREWLSLPLFDPPPQRACGGAGWVRQ